MHLLSGKGLLGLDVGIFPVRQHVITLHKVLAAYRVEAIAVPVPQP